MGENWFARANRGTTVGADVKKEKDNGVQRKAPEGGETGGEDACVRIQCRLGEK